MKLIISHAYLVNGNIVESPTNTLVETLNSLGEHFLFIRHPMNGEFLSYCYEFNNGREVDRKVIRTIKSPFVIMYISQIIFTLTFFIFQRSTKRITCIGVNPLNAIIGLLLKKVGIVNKLIFYSTDYTKTRFNNKILNRIYDFIDKFVALHADFVWSVSARIQKQKKLIGVQESKNILVPNTPSNEFRKYINYTKKKHSLVTLGVLGNQLDFYNFFDALNYLRKFFPDISLKVIGTGDKENELKNYVKKNNLDDIVFFLGFLSHGQALKEIASSSVGLALYNGNWSFNYYGDSMKCREYFCFGLPVLTTDTHSTVIDIKEFSAGIVTDQNVDNYVNAIKDIFSDYEKYSKQSYKLGRKYDQIHKKLLSKK